MRTINYTVEDAEFKCPHCHIYKTISFYGVVSEKTQNVT